MPNQSCSAIERVSIREAGEDPIASQQFAVLFSWTEKLSFPEPLLLNYF